ncbi:3-deoxy-manno-octulosonate cytidylyltransferase [Oceaniovalibus guishaninsula JLT2003]|uniref:3-deoxy-manno-octulosonate cytidylyltransferase n=1 Tax=Oceaniovalibus guishaninsula JLT2003 TaxID=1231392 RepID=K2HK33_9RHOB|nr:manno-octulosonate cytidylyltransferase [Oceaniovalibus guishaninsula]EKE43339.1 3-deoxy-manno-octulosonate cytidylyltransferase [Oceaniovalibus guishaninsula JLT2003]
MSVVIVIPARYASTRFPGKPLVRLRGPDGVARSLIERTWRAGMAVTGADRVVVATDDDRIAAEARGFGADVAMTSPDRANGTERCAEALESLGDVEIVVNLQGDAPLTPAWFIEDLVAGLRADPGAGVATPVLRCNGATLDALRADRREGRVGGTTAVFGAGNRALYFSKEVVPYCEAPGGPDDPTPVFHHVGVYAYRPEALRLYTSLPAGPLEGLEGLEQLRFLEHGHPILCVEVEARGAEFWELNNPEDVARIERMLERRVGS